MRTRVCEFEMYLRWNVLLLLYQNTWYQVYSPRYIFGLFLAVAPDVDHPTRTLTLPLTLIGTLWGDLCLDAVACEGSRLFRPEGDAVHGGRAFQNPHTRVYIHFFRTLADTWDKPRTKECSWNVLRALMYGNICVRSAGIVARIWGWHLPEI